MTPSSWSETCFEEMELHLAEIAYAQEVYPGVFRMGLRAIGVSRDAQAGQFYMVRVSQSLDPFLPRPFALHRRRLRGAEPGDEGDGLEILFQVVGRGTRLLARRSSGEKLELLGPLGRGWAMPKDCHPILVGGGMGVASLVSLAEDCSPAQRDRARVFLGARSPQRLWCVEDLRACGLRVQTAAEEGVHEFQGTVMDLLKTHWKEILPLDPFLFVCGPPAMVKKAAQWALSQGVPCRVSLESPMACGEGVCLGCAVKRSGGSGYMRICREGPVFDACEVDWDAWDAH